MRFQSHLSLGFFRELHEAEIFSLRNSHLRDVAVLGAGVTDVRFRRLRRDALDVDRARCKLRHGWSVADAAAAAAAAAAEAAAAISLGLGAAIPGAN